MGTLLVKVNTCRMDKNMRDWEFVARILGRGLGLRVAYREGRLW